MKQTHEQLPSAKETAASLRAAAEVWAEYCLTEHFTFFFLA